MAAGSSIEKRLSRTIVSKKRSAMSDFSTDIVELIEAKLQRKTNIFNKARKARERARQEAIENGEIDPEEEKKSASNLGKRKTGAAQAKGKNSSSSQKGQSAAQAA